MFIEFHMIQNFAPSNLNRDDTNNPKDCEFGGVRRARISSQCIKRAIRQEKIFSQTTEVPMGQRSRWLARDIKTRLMEAGKSEEEAAQAAIAFFEKLLGGMGKKENDKERSAVIFFISEEEKKRISEALLADWENALKGNLESTIKEYQKQFKERSSAPDIALFGRMLAEDPSLNLDAACQVAHAIFTHRVNMDIDFFTAVDDLQESDETGASMMGVTGFNSACFYRYMRIDWEQLLKNLGGDRDLSKKTVEGFMRAALSAVPSGKQNSFAAQNPPSFLLAVTRKDGMSWSLANAFEKPASAGYERSLVEDSILKADAYWGKLKSFYGGDAEASAALLIDGLELANLKDALADNAEAWIKSVLKNLPDQ